MGSSLVPLPQHRRTTSGLAEHPGALLPLLQTSPSLSGSSPPEQPPRRTVTLRERLCWPETRTCSSRPPPRSLSPRARAPICIFFAPPQPQEWQLGKGVSYNSKSCSEGCCFYTPASSKRVQEIEAEVEKNLPTWFRTPAGGCDAVPSNTFTSRLILNRENNDSGSEAALCVKAKDNDTFELLTGETTSCKGKCCVFNCKSCAAPES